MAKHLATKADVQAVRTELVGVQATLQSEIAGVRYELKSEIIRSELKSLIADIKSEIADIKSDLLWIKWLLGIWFFLGTIISTCILLLLLRLAGGL